MTKEKKIEAFNDECGFTWIGLDDSLPIKGNYVIDVNVTALDLSYIDDLIKELTEAKEIMEAE